MGSEILIITGLIIAVTAVIQLVYGITRGYKERIEIEEFSSLGKKIVFILGWAGYVSRGVILSIIAYSFFKAGLLNNGQLVVNTDKAFDFIGDNTPHIFYFIAAAGTICYGVFMFVLGVTYDIDKD